MQPLLNKSWIFCVVILFFCLAVTAPGRVIHVDDDRPADFNNIQAAIDDTNDADVVIVADGMYRGDGNRDIDFKGKAITMRSENGPENCIIDCNGTQTDPHRGFYFHSGEGADSILDGLTITGGYGPVNLEGSPKDSAGGAILCLGSSPTINNCTISANFASCGGGICCGEGSSPTISNCRFMHNTGSGGGMYCVFSKPTIGNCVVSGNVAPLYCDPFEGICIARYGAGIACESTSPTIVNCAISDNTASGEGGGLYFYRGDPVIRNCTITGNTGGKAGAIYCFSDSVLHISNCVLWGNTAEDGSAIFLDRWFDYCPTVAISYSVVQSGHNQIHTDRCNLSDYVNWGPGNIDVDPCFADPNKGDYHLKSRAGRWEPSENSKFEILNSKLRNGKWVLDDVTSPCIDAGDPTFPIGHEPFPNGGIINMGAYGGTAEASKSYFGEPVCETVVAGDINGDCKVDILDLSLMAVHWLEDNTPVNSNSIVDFGIQYYVQTDKLVYHFGESVEMLFRITNLTDQDVLIGCSQSPEFNLSVQKNGETIWMKVHGWYQFSPGICLSGAEPKKISYIWDMKDDNSNLIEPGVYDVVGIMYNEPWNYENHGDHSISEVGVPISITTNMPQL